MNDEDFSLKDIIEPINISSVLVYHELLQFLVGMLVFIDQPVLLDGFFFFFELVFASVGIRIKLRKNYDSGRKKITLLLLAISFCYRKYMLMIS